MTKWAHENYQKHVCKRLKKKRRKKKEIREL